MRVVIITNIPSPYRNPVWALLPRGQYTVVFCARVEGNREWKLPPPSCDHVFLNECAKANLDGYNFVHNNPDIWQTLNRLRPQVVVTTGINPTHLYAYAWTLLHRVHHIYMTDGTERSEASLSWKHRWVRRLVIGGSTAGVAASLSGLRLLQGYGLSPARVHLSRLCADNSNFRPLSTEDRPYDVMFCGQIHERKLPGFFVSVCIELKRRRGHCRALVLGNGSERDRMLSALLAEGIDTTYPGFIQPESLATWYQQVKLLLFTTRLDPWGVVANEAMASGTPVITTPEAGVAHDLVIDRVNGRVLPTDVSTWAQVCSELLDDSEKWQAMSTLALRQVQLFTYESAALGLMSACEQSIGAH